MTRRPATALGGVILALGLALAIPTSADGSDDSFCRNFSAGAEFVSPVPSLDSPVCWPESASWRMSSLAPQRWQKRASSGTSVEHVRQIMAFPFPPGAEREVSGRIWQAFESNWVGPESLRCLRSVRAL